MADRINRTEPEGGSFEGSHFAASEVHPWEEPSATEEASELAVPVLLPATAIATSAVAAEPVVPGISSNSPESEAASASTRKVVR